jgi:hypothetical protein
MWDQLFKEPWIMHFRDLIGKTIEIYQDDLTVFSKERKDHVHHPRQIFYICGKYGISLNLKKSIFRVDEGKLLGHVKSNGEVKIDPTRIEAIQKIPLLRPRRLCNLSSER